jgi:hypothetical protein
MLSPSKHVAPQAPFELVENVVPRHARFEGLERNLPCFVLRQAQHDTGRMTRGA